MTSIFAQAFGCCLGRKRGGGVDEETPFLQHPIEPPQASYTDVQPQEQDEDTELIKERMGHIVWSKQSRMVNVNDGSQSRTRDNSTDPYPYTRSSSMSRRPSSNHEREGTPSPSSSSVQLHQPGHPARSAIGSGSGVRLIRPTSRLKRGRSQTMKAKTRGGANGVDSTMEAESEGRSNGGDGALQNGKHDIQSALELMDSQEHGVEKEEDFHPETEAMSQKTIPSKAQFASFQDEAPQKTIPVSEYVIEGADDLTGGWGD